VGFVHLHAHCDYSQLDGCGKARLHVARAAELGHEAIALTDHGTMAGILEHREACDEYGLRSIPGIEAYFREDAKQHNRQNRRAYHLVLLAINMNGWKNLIRLSTASYRSDYFYYRPCVDWDLLERYSDGLVAFTSCLSGFIPAMLLQGNEEEAVTALKRMVSIFGDRLFVEIQPHDIPEQKVANLHLASFAQKYGLPLVATCDVHYPYEEWAGTHDVLVMCSTGQTLKTREAAREKGDDYLSFSGNSFYVMSKEETLAAFAHHHPELPAHLVTEAISNTNLIVSHSHFLELDRSPKIPRFSSQAGNSEQALRSWCEEGLKRLHKEDDAQYRKRMEEELDVMRRMDSLSYMAIIADAVRWAKFEAPGRPIAVGAGRGSAAGSLVAFLCRITSVDPIGHELLFERFLNEHRAEQPDVDIDFQHDRRNEIKSYLADRWGRDNVSDIASYVTFGMRTAIKDVSRVLKIPFPESAHVTSLLEGVDGDTTLETALSISGVAAFAEKYPHVWKHAVRIEGQTKTNSRHPGGVVVADRPIYEYMPTMKAKDGHVITQWSQTPIVKYGFVKIDVLATDALTRRDYAMGLIEQRHGIKIDFEDIDSFPVIVDQDAAENDVIDAFGHGMTLGVFQFESLGITGLLRQIKPTSFTDLVAANALYRPGPLDSGTAYLYGDRKNGRKPYDLDQWGPATPFVERTYGIIVFQEQVVQVTSKLAGWTPARADELRHTIGKGALRDPRGAKELRQKGEEFVADVCSNLGHSQKDFAYWVWKQVIFFSQYSFNRSHAAGYAMEAYRDMWLKLRYPLEFYAALMSYEPDKLAKVIREATTHGINILPPDINASELSFTLDTNAIRFGLSPVAYVGDAAIGEIIDKRPFYSLDDFKQRVMSRRCNSRARQNLHDCGAFDSIGGRADWEQRDCAKAERKILGFALSGGSELSRYKDIIDARIHSSDEIEQLPPGSRVTVAGEVISVREIKSKRGQMAFVDLMYGENMYSCTFFAEPYMRYKGFLLSGEIVIVGGRKDRERGSVLADTACEIEKLVNALKKGEANAGRPVAS